VRFLAALLAGCGPSWTQQDHDSVKAALRSQQALLGFCEADASVCSPATVRQTELSSVCNLGATLQRHGDDVLDGGAACRP
jgi:hypothetical protein